jgi:release factor glutamine methyltransferase
MRTLLEILTLSTNYLQQRGIQNPRRQAEELISDALGMPRLKIYLEFDRPLSDLELDTCRQRLARRAKGEPLQYIAGEMDFYGCKITVTPKVLIPRQETEILVDRIAKQLEKEELEGKCLWDICCGSGCMGIALKKKFPQLQVTLADISKEALDIAKKNAEINQVEVEILQGDLLQPFIGRRVNFLVCNPPYIAEHEFNGLDVEVRDFEPRQALISGPTGLEFYDRLASGLRDFLIPSSKVWLEIGSGQGLSIYEIFQKKGWSHGKVEKDWAGHDRFFFLENESFLE